MALNLAGDYQIFVDTPWRDSGPEELAGQVCEKLARGPATWRASWRAIKPDLLEPALAGSSWWREQF